MDIIITNQSDRPIYEQIMDQIKAQIMNGELKEGDALPSMRLLAKELRISIITTKRAYEELEREGYIYTIKGKGSFVSDTLSAADSKRKEIMDDMEKLVTKALMSGITTEELEKMLAMCMENIHK